MEIKFIEQKAELITEHDPLLKLELCGRVCYKSENKISDGSAEKLIGGVIKRGHESVLEHFRISANTHVETLSKHFFELIKDVVIFPKADIYERQNAKNYIVYDGNGVLSGNVRAWRKFFKTCSKLLLRPFKEKYPFLFSDIDLDETSVGDAELFESTNYKTFRLTTNRGVSHEIVRHRVFSFSQESTRYCNYKGEFQYVIPYPFDFATNQTEAFTIWKNSCINSSHDYVSMIEKGCTPQMARDVLNNSLKTEIIVTGTDYQWEWFMKLRKDVAAHPEIRLLSEIISSKL